MEQCGRIFIVLNLHLLLLVSTFQQSTARIQNRPRSHDVVNHAIISAKYNEISCLRDDELLKGGPHSVKWISKPKATTFKGKDNSNRLISSAVIMKKDQGTYVCEATRKDGYVLNRTIKLCVSPSDVSTNRPEEFTLTPESVYSEEGGEVDFKCETYVGPQECGIGNPYEITWSKRQKDGTWVPLNASENINITRRTIVSEGVGHSQLRIRSVQSSDYGIYQCNISNEFGSAHSTIILTDEIPAHLLRIRHLWIVFGVLVFVMFSPCLLYAFRHSKAHVALRWRSYKFDPSFQDRYTYDVVVLHGHSSYTWVFEKLLPVLEGHYGYRCFIPVRDMIGGEDPHLSVTRAIEECRCVMIIVTPCFLEDTNCLYATLQATCTCNQLKIMPMKMMFPVILQPTRKKELCQRPLSRNELGVLYLLKQLKSVSVRVPESCLHAKDSECALIESDSDKAQKLNLKSEIKLKDSNLLIPQNENCKVRSLSKSPKVQRVKNMITGSNGSLELSKSFDNLYSGLTDGINAAGKDTKVETHSISKDGNPIVREQKKRWRLFSLHSTQESEMDVQEFPETPCSTTPFIFPCASPQEKFFSRSTLHKWTRVLLKGDDEDLFWKKVILRLPPVRPLNEDRAVDV